MTDDNESGNKPVNQQVVVPEIVKIQTNTPSATDFEKVLEVPHKHRTKKMIEAALTLARDFFAAAGDIPDTVARLRAMVKTADNTVESLITQLDEERAQATKDAEEKDRMIETLQVTITRLDAKVAELIDVRDGQAIRLDVALNDVKSLRHRNEELLRAHDGIVGHLKNGEIERPERTRLAKKIIKILIG
jgi:hypothetical protein